MSPDWQGLLTSTGNSSGTPGRVNYFKRYRMEVDLHQVPSPVLRPEYQWIAWNAGLIETHAEVLSHSFRNEIDAIVFPSLSTLDGCTRLMTEIARKPGFLPSATWLVTTDSGVCATIQGITERSGVGAIQNVGVLPGFRGQGLGAQLVFQALQGFRSAGLIVGQLEVTARNERALQLYSRLGFRRVKTIYKAVVQPFAHYDL